MQLECTAILFDLDGVLIDSTTNIIRHWQRWAQRHDLDLAEIMRVAHGRITIETMQLVAPRPPCSLPCPPLPGRLSRPAAGPSPRPA